MPAPSPVARPFRPQFQHQALDAVGAQTDLKVVGRHDHADAITVSNPPHC